MKIGILLHVYHLGATNWEALCWGDPQNDHLGTLTKLIELVSSIPPDVELEIIVYSGPSVRNGLGEGSYAKKYLLDHLEQAEQFAKLAYLSDIDSHSKQLLNERLQNITEGPTIKDTREEVRLAAQKLTQNGLCDKIYQIASPSHAPRCLQNQLTARRDGFIPYGQSWEIVTSEVCFEGQEIENTVIVEPPHRGDDPTLNFKPSFAELCRRYFSLNTENKREMIELIDKLTRKK